MSSNLPLVCVECLDTGWIHWVQPYGRPGLIRVPHDPNIDIPPAALIIEPCDCGKPKNKEEE